MQKVSCKDDPEREGKDKKEVKAMLDFSKMRSGMVELNIGGREMKTKMEPLSSGQPIHKSGDSTWFLLENYVFTKNNMFPWRTHLRRNKSWNDSP